MLDFIFEFIGALLSRVFEALLWLFGTGFRKLARLFKRANRVPLVSGSLLTMLALLPSCVQWNLGENVLTASETYIAIDYRHPVGKQVYYQSEPNGKRRYFARLPEVRYHRMPELVALEYGHPKKYDASVVEATGHSVLAELDVTTRNDSPAPGALLGIKRIIPALPAGLLALPPANYDYNPRAMVNSGRLEPGKAPGSARKIAANALSYSIDPLLTFVSTTAFCCAALPLEILSFPFIWTQHTHELHTEAP